MAFEFVNRVGRRFRGARRRRNPAFLPVLPSGLLRFARNDGCRAVCSHGCTPQIHPRRTPVTRLNSKLSVISACGLTFGAWAVCSRNLWEARAVICVIKLPNSLSSSYPGAPPGMARAIQKRAVCVGPLSGPFLFSQTEVSTSKPKKPRENSASGASHE
jgi:hypothetical protein